MRMDLPALSGSLAASEVALAQRIGAERKRRGWSQERLAREVSARLGSSFPQSAISRLERGPEGRAVSAAELIAFGLVFEVDPLSLMLPEASFELHQVLAALTELEQAMSEMHHASIARERARDRLIAAAENFREPLRRLDEAGHEQVMDGLKRVGRREDMELVWATVVSQLHMEVPGLGDLVGPEVMEDALATIRSQTGASTDAEVVEAPVGASA